MYKRSLSLLVFLLALPAAAQLSAPRGGTPDLLIPVAGAAQGIGGTFFRSDITIINYRNVSQLVRLRWLPQNSSGAGVAPVDVTIPASSGIVSEDFVTAILGQSGVGAILVTATTAEGTTDTNGRLFATSRVWTPQPGSTGTVSQSTPAIPTTDIANPLRLTIIGQRRDDRYRTNVGIVNLAGATEQTFRVTVSTGGGATQLLTVTVPPLSMVQTPLLGGATPTLQITVENMTIVKSPFTAYGASVDNVTGDGWSTLGFVPAGQ
jgi:hypothetical protein